MKNIQEIKVIALSCLFFILWGSLFSCTRKKENPLKEYLGFLKIQDNITFSSTTGDTLVISDVHFDSGYSSVGYFGGNTEWWSNKVTFKIKSFRNGIKELIDSGELELSYNNVDSSIQLNCHYFKYEIHCDNIAQIVRNMNKGKDIDLIDFTTSNSFIHLAGQIIDVSDPALWLQLKRDTGILKFRFEDSEYSYTKLASEI